MARVLELKFETSRRQQNGANDNAKPEHGVGFGITARWQTARSRTAAPVPGRVSNGYPRRTSFSPWQVIAISGFPFIRAPQAKAARENRSLTGRHIRREIFEESLDSPEIHIIFVRLRTIFSHMSC